MPHSFGEKEAKNKIHSENHRSFFKNRRKLRSRKRMKANKRFLFVLAVLFEAVTCCDAFVQNAPRSSPTVRPQFLWPPVDKSKTESSISTNEFNFESGAPTFLDEDILTTNPILETKKERLPWICMLFLFLYTQTVGGSTILPVKNVCFSAVSATLLRQGSNKPRISKRLIIGGALVSWQLSQGPNILSVVSTSLPQFAAWYMGCLSKFPLFTKALTSGIIGVFGDSAAQVHEARTKNKARGLALCFQNYDRRRGLSVLLDGILVSGPLLHFAYDFLEKSFPVAGTGGIAASIAALTQVLIDDLVVDALAVAIMFFTTGFGEGYSLRQIIPQIRNDYFKTLKTSWATSIVVMPLEFALFRFFPLSLRVLGMDFIDIIWAAIVSYMIHRRRKAVKLEPAACHM